MAKFAAKDSNKNITLSPHGTGKVVVGTGAADATVQSDGDHNLVLQTGNATTGSISITDGADGDIAISPNGTGKVVVGTGATDATVQSDGNHNLVLQTGNATTGSISITDGADGDIAISPNGTGTVVVNTDLTVDNINIDSNKVRTTSSADLKLTTSSEMGVVTVENSGNIRIAPHNTGLTYIDDINIDGNLIKSAASQNLVLKDSAENAEIRIETGGNIHLIPVSGGTVHCDDLALTGTVTGTVDVSGATLTLSTAQKQDISATAFASGTKMIFQQSSAPTGWTKDYNSPDHIALRVCGSGTFQSGVGGSVAFTSAFGATIAVAGGAHTLTGAELPTLASRYSQNAGTSNTMYRGGNHAGNRTDQIRQVDGTALGGGSHTHATSGTGSDGSSHNLSVKYVDVIICSKD